MRSNMFLLAVVVALGVACGDSTGPDAIAGTYALQTVNGEALPCCGLMWAGVRDVDGEQLFVEEVAVLVRGSLHLHNDAAFIMSFVYETTEVRYDLTGNEVARIVTTDPALTLSGTYTVNGMSVQLTYSDGRVRTGSNSGDVLTVMDGGVAYVYER